MDPLKLPTFVFSTTQERALYEGSSEIEIFPMQHARIKVPYRSFRTFRASSISVLSRFLLGFNTTLLMEDLVKCPIDTGENLRRAPKLDSPPLGESSKPEHKRNNSITSARSLDSNFSDKPPKSRAIIREVKRFSPACIGELTCARLNKVLVAAPRDATIQTTSS